MSKLTIDEVAHIATLARLGLSDVELEQLSSQLTSILDFVDELQDVDTAGVEPTSQVTGLSDIWREDVVHRSDLSRDELLANAPLSENGFVKVKRIL